MTRVLFVYRYCTMGGVETGMRFRIEALPRYDIEAHALFLRDYGGRAMFAGMQDKVFFGPSEETFVDLVRANGYDLISVIDSFDVMEWIDGMAYDGRVMVELRSTYEHTLVHLKRLSEHRLHGILVPSNFQAENIRQYLPRKVRDGVPCHVVYNFVDLEHFRYDPTARPTTHRQIVCWVGRIDPLKNWPEFLAVAERLISRADVEFWMVGGGGSDADARNDFRKALNGTQLAPRLRWWPILPNARMSGLYSLVANSGGTVLLTTKCESFGFAALEATACRCPVVAARVGALPEVIQDGQTGLLYESGNVARAAECVARVLDDGALRTALAERSEAAVRERFCAERCGTSFAQAIRDVVGQPT